jgi:hypothetical protein
VIAVLDGAVAEHHHLFHLGHRCDRRIHAALFRELDRALIALRARRLGATAIDLGREPDRVLVVVHLAVPDRERGLTVLRHHAGGAALAVLGRASGRAERDVPLLHRPVGRVEVELVRVVREVPRDGARGALRVGQRAALLEGVAARSETRRFALVLGRVAVFVAVRVGAEGSGLGRVALDEARHRVRVLVEVRALPDLRLVQEPSPHVVAHPVVAGVAEAIGVEAAVRLEAVAIPIAGLEVAVGDPAERLADRDLDRAARAGREGAAAEVGVEEARRERVDAPPEVAEVDGAGGRERLVGDVEVAVLELEHGRVRVLGIGDVVVERLVGHAAVDADEREGVVVVAVGVEVPRPVDAHVRALVPRTVAGVLLEHVELLAGGRVVGPHDVEVALDRIRDDDHAVLRGGARALSVGVLDPLVREPSEQHLFGDLPADARDRLRVGGREEPVLRGAVSDVDQGALGPELRIVGGVLQILADEVRLLERKGLHSIDRVPFLGAAREGGRHKESDHRVLHHVLTSPVISLTS